MNSKCKFLIVLSLFFMFFTLQVQAEKYKGPIVKPKTSPKSSASCVKPSKDTELAINMVRAYLKTDGTMWFRENAEYEVPKGSGKTSMFSAALWIGGKDVDGNLYLAAMKFGQQGNDYWTGPLEMVGARTNPSRCAQYDRFFHISRVEVERHKNAFENDDTDDYVIPKSILEWPATAPLGSGLSHYLAPFKKGLKNPDRDINKAVYEPEKGDYPYYDLPNELCPWTPDNKLRAMKIPWLNSDGKADWEGFKPNPEALPLPPEREWTRDKDVNQNNYTWDNWMIYADHVLKGDATVFWFLNDNGGVHTESGGMNIGLEIRVQAFAFATNDELNKMTFYSYEIINRGSTTLYNTFFSQWADPDLGFANDDFVGCDVNRGLGYCYNGKDIDGSGQPWAYGANPPAVGIDFFQGPYIDPDGQDNPKFFKELADINGSADQQEYCKKFVHYLVERWGKDGPGPDMLHEPHGTQKLIVDLIDTAGNPYQDTVDLFWNNQFAINGVNFGDGIVDNERFGMRRFVFHNNSHQPTGDPNNAQQYYNLLQGIWKDGVPMTYGGTGYSPGSGIEANFMFPGRTDYCNWGTQGVSPGAAFQFGGRTGIWTEETPTGSPPPNQPADRRIMQSAGPFTLKRGACNYITVGIPWARTTSGGPMASVRLLEVADDKCQALFENCFKIIDGPDAPNLTIREYDQKLILLLSNSPLSNNRNESYMERDFNLQWSEQLDSLFGIKEKDFDKIYRFEGYKIYQVTGPDVGSNDLDNPSMARLIFQCDLVNYDKKGFPIGRLINWEFDENLQVIVPKEKVDGANTGIKHSFEVTQDAFATGARQLVNYKTYYFVAIAYAYNEFLPFYINKDDPDGLWGQPLPYLRGRKTADGKSVMPIAAIPHPPRLHKGGLTLHSDYGSIPKITRLDGQGNGGMALELTQETIDKILSGGDNNDYRVRKLEYKKNAGPLNIKVVDPLRVKPYEYTIFIKEKEYVEDSFEVSENAYWELRISDSITDKQLIADSVVNFDGTAMRVFKSMKNLRTPDGALVKDSNGKDSLVERSISEYDEYIIFPLGLSIAIHNTDFVNHQTLVKNNWNRILQSCKNNVYKAKLRFCHPEKITIANDIVYAGAQWITGLSDDNDPLPSNWIRAGSKGLGTWATLNTNTNNGGAYKHYHEVRLEDFFYPTRRIVTLYNPKISPAQNPDELADRAFKDYTGQFGTICNGTWAPYVLASPYEGGPQAKYTSPEPYFLDGTVGEPLRSYYWTYEYQWGMYPFEPRWRNGNENDTVVPPRLQQPGIHPGFNQTMTNLYSVDVVLTPDKSKWTRSIVLESCSDPRRSVGGALKNEPRRQKSVDKNGNPDGSNDGFGPNGDEGMGWFPGYAINLETGERLNIMFSENSDTTLHKFFNSVRGNDMIFNPTSAYAIATMDIDFSFFGIRIVFKAGDLIDRQTYNELYYIFDGNYNPEGGALGPFGLLEDYGIIRVWGGMHYVYVCGSSGNTSPVYFMDGTGEEPFFNNARRNFNLNDTVVNFSYYQYDRSAPHTNPYATGKYGGFIDAERKYPEYECGPYDESRWLVRKFKQFLDSAEARPYRSPYYTNPNLRADVAAPWDNDEYRMPHSYRSNYKMQLFNNVMYTHIPMQPADVTLQSKWLSGDVTYKIRVTRPYMRYTSRWYESPELRDADFPNAEWEFPEQRGYPVYQMSTKDLAPVYNETRLYQSILDEINIVPNPYYGGSLYERNAIETKVKIINLPTDLKNDAPVTINIFTVNGILVRTLTKGDSKSTFVDWDLKNFANIPVAGGVYIIHVNCPGIGERMLKFFCTMRPTDLNTF